MDPRSLYILAMMACFCAAVVNALFFGLELRRFLDQTGVLASTRDVENFKTTVARQMYAALAQIVLLTAPMLIYLAGIISSALMAKDIVFLIAPSLVVLLVAAGIRTWERRAKTIAVADPELQKQRDIIVKSWLEKPFPDW